MNSSATDPVISFRRVTKRFPGVVALRDVSLDVVAGETARHRRRKRRRQKHAHEMPFGPDRRLRGQNARPRPAGPLPRRHRQPTGRHQHHPPGTQPGRRAIGRRQHLSGTREAGTLRPARRSGDGRSGRRVAPPASVRGRAAARRSAGFASATSNWWKSPRPCRWQADILIMDEPTSALTARPKPPGCFASSGGSAARASRSSTSPTRWTRSSAWPTASPCCATASLCEPSPRTDTTAREITHLMVGRQIEETDLGQPRTPGEAVLEVRGLSLPWPGHAAKWRLRDINFTLRRGEILGVAGLMGAGRTELLECLFGSSPRIAAGRDPAGGPTGRLPPAGSSQAGRRRPGDRGPQAAGNLCQSRRWPQHQPVPLEEVARFGWINCRRERAMAGGAAEQLGVKTPDLATPITSLSGGNQQKAIVGRWLLTRPKVLLLDDPTRGRRRGGQGRPLSHHGRALPRRSGNRAHLQRAARVAHVVRPHRRALRRAHDGRAPPRRGHRAADYGASHAAGV